MSSTPSTRRGLLRRTLSLGLAIGVTGAGIALTAAPAQALSDSRHRPHATPEDAVLAAAVAGGWVADQLVPAAGGSQAYATGFGGTPSLSNTAYAVLAMSSTGFDKSARDAAMSYLLAHVPATSDDATNPGQLALIVLAAHSSGKDSSVSALLPRLSAVVQTSPNGGPVNKDAGLFGSGDPTYDGAFRQSLGLLAFAALGQAPPAGTAAWLTGQQCTDGGWESYRTDTTAACTAPDPTTFAGEDTNSTALAIQALTATSTTIPTSPIAFLHTGEVSGGGFADFPGGSPDPNSTALVTQALLDLGENPLDSTGNWVKGGKAPIDYLLAQQVGCDGDPADIGGLVSPFSNGAADFFATVQAVPALSGLPLPIDPDVMLDQHLDPPCATATPVATLPAPTAAPGHVLVDFTDSDTSTITVKTGHVLDVFANGFKAGSTVTISIHSTPVVVGHAVASSTGTIHIAVTVPQTLSTGAHTLVLTGVGTTGSARVLRQALSVRLGTLPVTGAVVPLAAAGAAGTTLLVAGLATIGLATRRRRLAVIGPTGRHRRR